MKLAFLLIGLLLFFPAVLQARWWNGCFWDNTGFWSYFNYGGGMFMWIINLAVLGIIIFFGIKFFKNINGNGTSNKEDPFEILKLRYANGEISIEEYEKIKNDII
jgi:putative membrane protein